jgi:hypothetical protein
MVLLDNLLEKYVKTDLVVIFQDVDQTDQRAVDVTKT